MHKDLYNCPRKATETRYNGAVQTQQGASAPAPAPKTLGSFAQQVLDALVPNEESILRLAGMAGNGAAAGAGRVPSEGSGGEFQFDPWSIITPARSSCAGPPAGCLVVCSEGVTLTLMIRVVPCCTPDPCMTYAFASFSKDAPMCSALLHVHDNSCIRARNPPDLPLAREGDVLRP